MIQGRYHDARVHGGLSLCPTANEAERGTRSKPNPVAALSCQAACPSGATRTAVITVLRPVTRAPSAGSGGRRTRPPPDAATSAQKAGGLRGTQRSPCQTAMFNVAWAGSPALAGKPAGEAWKPGPSESPYRRVRGPIPALSTTAKMAASQGFQRRPGGGSASATRRAHRLPSRSEPGHAAVSSRRASS